MFSIFWPIFRSFLGCKNLKNNREWRMANGEWRYLAWCGRCEECRGDRNLDINAPLKHYLIARVEILSLNKGVTACRKVPWRDRNFAS